MNSSTSNSKSEWKVLVAVATFLLVLEVGARFAAPFLDRDRGHIHDFPAIADELSRGEYPRILFLGNSLTLHGLDKDMVRDDLIEAGFAQPTIGWTVPVGTDATDWIYLFDQYFKDENQIPDIVIVGYVRHHVRDHKPTKRLRRLGRHFLSLSDMKECFDHDVVTFEARAEVLLSNVSSLYGDQPNYRETALGELLPGFWGAEKRFNRSLEQRQEALSQGKDAPAPTFTRISRLSQKLKESGCLGIFVAMPLPEPWDTDPEVEAAVKASGMAYVDARAIEGLTAKDFPDGYHMGERAKEFYSHFIAKRIAEQLEKKK